MSDASRSEDDREREPGQAVVEAEEQDRGVDHQAVGERVGELAELRLDVPAPGEEPSTWSVSAGGGEEDRGGRAPPAVRAEHERRRRRG